MGQRWVKATQGVEDIRSLDEGMPFGRVCKSEEVANVVRFLVFRSEFLPNRRASLL